MLTSMQRTVSASALTLLTMLSGCATQPRSGDYYGDTEAERDMTVRLAVVESVRDVVLDRQSRDGVGTLAGAVFGGVAGRSIGQGATIGAVAGSIIGGFIDRANEGDATRVPAMEITVKLADGSLIAIVQKAGAVRPSAGDQVRLVSSGGSTRVVPI